MKAKENFKDFAEIYYNAIYSLLELFPMQKTSSKIKAGIYCSSEEMIAEVVPKQIVYHDWEEWGADGSSIWELMARNCLLGWMIWKEFGFYHYFNWGKQGSSKLTLAQLLSNFLSEHI